MLNCFELRRRCPKRPRISVIEAFELVGLHKKFSMR
jgi:hypothetical protein